ncbi:MAG: hypothetical protein ACOZB3_01225, partial [Calditrichota bacterium]
NGRPVEGGGGVAPDFEVKAPQPGPLGVELWRRGSFFDFTNEYRSRHPNLTSSKMNEPILAEFRDWLDSTGFHYDMDGYAELDTLRKMAEETGLTDSLQNTFAALEDLLTARRAQAYEDERDFIRMSLESEMAASLYGSRGRIEASFADDPVIQKALTILDNQQTYHKTLVAVDSDKGQ